MIWNPPSAWAVAKRDAPQVAEDCWTFPNPRGPKGRMVPHRPYFWGIWNFARTNERRQGHSSLYLSQREQVEGWPKPSPAMTSRRSPRCHDLKIWSEVEPPKGTIYNYPVRPWHDAEYYITGLVRPARDRGADLEPQRYPDHGRRLVAGQTIKRPIDWAKDELEGFTRLSGPPAVVAALRPHDPALRGASESSVPGMSAQPCQPRGHRR